MSETTMVLCPVCGGTGEVQIVSSEGGFDHLTCSNCRGTGEVSDAPAAPASEATGSGVLTPAELIEAETAVYADIQASKEASLKAEAAYWTSDDEKEIERLTRELADANDRLAKAERALECIKGSSDIGMLFDGHDELNEETYEANEALLTGVLDSIHEVTLRALAARRGGKDER